MIFYQQKKDKEIIAAVYEEWQCENDPPIREYEAWSVVGILAPAPHDHVIDRVYLSKAQLGQEYCPISEEEAEELAPSLLRFLHEFARPDEVRPAQATLHAVCTHGEQCRLPEHSHSKMRRSRETWYTILDDVNGEPIAMRLSEEGGYMSIYRSPGLLTNGRLLDHNAIVATLRVRGYEKIHYIFSEEFKRKVEEYKAKHLGITVEEWRSF